MDNETLSFVRLDGCMADDISVVNSARVSFAKSSQEMDDAAKGLVNFLMRERHGTPFEHNAFRFHVKCPVFVAREWFRHRIGSFNEFSARYSEVPNEFWSPELGSVRKQIGKPGSYSFEPVEKDIANMTKFLIENWSNESYLLYKRLLDLGVAKEISRAVLPMSMYTQFYWTVNARSLMNFLSLRTDDNAQREIREMALEVEKIFAEKMPITYSAWIANGKVAP